MKNIFRKILFIIIYIGLFILMIFVLNIKKEKLKVEQENSLKLTYATNHKQFFIALNCAEQFLKIVSENNINDIMSLINIEYKNENNITKDNILNYLPKLSANKMHKFSATKVFKKRISKNVIEYYLEGKIISLSMGEESSKDYTLGIVLYEDKNIYSIKFGKEDIPNE